MMKARLPGILLCSSLALWSGGCDEPATTGGGDSGSTGAASGTTSTAGTTDPTQGTTEAGSSSSTTTDAGSTTGTGSTSGSTSGSTGATTGDSSSTGRGSTSGESSTGSGPACSDGTLDEGEDCDGDALGVATCESLGFAGGGTLSCDKTCSYDTSACLAVACGEIGPQAGGECPDVCYACDTFDGPNMCRMFQPPNNGEVTCPEGFVCDVFCAGPFACTNSVINCADEDQCTVTCEDAACTGAEINCGAGSTCDVRCNGSVKATPACQSASVNCGGGLCEVNCELSFDSIGPQEVNGCEDGCGCDLNEECADL